MIEKNQLDRNTPLKSQIMNLDHDFDLKKSVIRLFEESKKRQDNNSFKIIEKFYKENEAQQKWQINDNSQKIIEKNRSYTPIEKRSKEILEQKK